MPSYGAAFRNWSIMLRTIHSSFQLSNSRYFIILKFFLKNGMNPNLTYDKKHINLLCYTILKFVLITLYPWSERKDCFSNTEPMKISLNPIWE